MTHFSLALFLHDSSMLGRSLTPGSFVFTVSLLWNRKDIEIWYWITW